MKELKIDFAKYWLHFLIGGFLLLVAIIGIAWFSVLITISSLKM